MWPFSLLNRAPKLVVYVAVLVLLQTIYALVMTSNIRNVRQQKEADNPANSSIRTATMVTVPGKNGLKYNTTHRDFIRLLDVICSHRNMALRVTWRRDCPCPPPKLIHRQNLRATLKPINMTTLIKLHPEVSKGGNYTPACNPIQRIAIIVPVRYRNDHLRMYVHYMHSFLQRQLLSYTIFAVEQSAEGTFNKARLMNAGFVEIEKNFGPFDCYIFNDVDMFPEEDRNIQACVKNVRHLGSHVSKFSYKVAYAGIFGGVIGLSGPQFHLVNGFSNTYVGWGGEDDDMFHRVRTRRLAVVRHPTLNYYYMVPHKRDTGNPTNPQSAKAWRWLKAGDYDKEGLNTLTYNLMSIDRLPAYTRILFNFTVPFKRPQQKTTKHPALTTAGAKTTRTLTAATTTKATIPALNTSIPTVNGTKDPN